jgi:hypothetical protein
MLELASRPGAEYSRTDYGNIASLTHFTEKSDLLLKAEAAGRLFKHPAAPDCEWQRPHPATTL